MRQHPQSAFITEPNPFEPHYTAQEVADLWKLDVSTVRRLFCDESGVIKFGSLGRRDGKRDYITLRIPESVVRRVHAKRIERGVQR
jgi:hypothetical protein